MTKKAEKKEAKITTAKKTLYQAVQDNETEEFIIVGALFKANLLEQYEHEKIAFSTGTEDLQPTITDAELEKIIKEFTGE